MVEIKGDETGCVKLALLEPTDGPALRRLFFRLSAETVYRRFHSPVVRPEQTQPQRLLDVDHHAREAVVAVEDGEIVGVARYVGRPGTGSAEIAIVVADGWQRQGIATRMLSALHDRAEAEGVTEFTLTIQADNRPMLELFRRFYPGIRGRSSYGMYEAVVPVARTA